MRRSLTVLLLAASAACSVFGTRLVASVIPPIGLAPGSQYQLVFITAGKHDAASSDIADYNAFVAAQAALNPLLPLATWHAVASTDSINSVVNAPASGLPVYNTRGIEVSSPLSKFYFNVHLFPIFYDQFGTGSTRIAWTGSTPEGLEYLGIDIGGLGNATGRTVSGDANTANFNWADGNFGGDLSAPAGFYALSTPITVPVVPEPATPTLLASALLAIGGLRALRWRRGRKNQTRTDDPQSSLQLCRTLIVPLDSRTIRL